MHNVFRLLVLIASITASLHSMAKTLATDMIIDLPKTKYSMRNGEPWACLNKDVFEEVSSTFCRTTEALEPISSIVKRLLFTRGTHNAIEHNNGLWIQVIAEEGEIARAKNRLRKAGSDIIKSTDIAPAGSQKTNSRVWVASSFIHFSKGQRYICSAWPGAARVQRGECYSSDGQAFWLDYRAHFRRLMGPGAIATFEQSNRTKSYFNVSALSQNVRAAESEMNRRNGVRGRQNSSANTPTPGHAESFSEGNSSTLINLLILASIFVIVHVLYSVFYKRRPSVRASSVYNYNQLDLRNEIRSARPSPTSSESATKTKTTSSAPEVGEIFRETKKPEKPKRTYTKRKISID